MFTKIYIAQVRIDSIKVSDFQIRGKFVDHELDISVAICCYIKVIAHKVGFM